MFHPFCFNDNYYLYDVESGSFHAVDKLVYSIVSKEELSSFSNSEINSANAEINELKKAGLLDVPPQKIELREEKIIVKALCIHICHDCNLRCKYCFADGGSYMSSESEYMSLETGKKAIDFLINNSGKRRNLEVDFFGGEPLMNFDVVKQITAYAKDAAKSAGKEIKLTMTTNCLLLDDEKIEFLNREMDNVVLSLDGRKCVNDEVRITPNNKGSFEVVIKNALKFASVRGDKDYYVRGTFTRNNLDFADDITFLQEQGFKQLSIEPVVLPSSSPYAILDEHIEQIKFEYDKLAKKYIMMRKNNDTWFNFFHFMIDLTGGPCVNKRIKGCGAGVEYFAISPVGDIYPCHQFVGKTDFKLGDVDTGIINLKKTTMFKTSNLTTKDECKNCWAKYHCGGGCAANNYNFNGDIDKPYTLSCEMFKKRLELSLGIYAEEHTK